MGSLILFTLREEKLDLVVEAEVLFRGPVRLGNSLVSATPVSLNQIRFGQILRLFYGLSCAISIMVDVGTRPYQDDAGIHFTARIMLLNRWWAAQNNPGEDFSQLIAGQQVHVTIVEGQKPWLIVAPH